MRGKYRLICQKNESYYREVAGLILESYSGPGPSKVERLSLSGITKFKYDSTLVKNSHGAIVLREDDFGHLFPHLNEQAYIDEIKYPDTNFLPKVLIYIDPRHESTGYATYTRVGHQHISGGSAIHEYFHYYKLKFDGKNCFYEYHLTSPNDDEINEQIEALDK